MAEMDLDGLKAAVEFCEDNGLSNAAAAVRHAIAALERAEEVADQGCEFCDAKVTDQLETDEGTSPHAHGWVCLECRNKEFQRAERLEKALRHIENGGYPAAVIAKAALEEE